MNIVKDPGRENVEIKWANGATTLATDKPTEVPEGCEAEAAALIRESGIIRETKDKPPKAPTMEERAAATADDADEKKTKRSSKK